MNRNELIADVANRTGFTKKAATVFVEAYEQAIIEAISREDTVQLHKFMKIERRKQNVCPYDFKRGKSAGVQEQERIMIRPGSLLTDCLNQGGG